MQSQNNSFASTSSASKGRSPGERSSPSTPGDTATPAAPNGAGSTNGDGNNQQDWTFEEQFKQVSFLISRIDEFICDVEIEVKVAIWCLILDPNGPTK